MAENPLTRDVSSCQVCGAPTTSAHRWRMRWSYFYTPNRLIGFLAVFAAVAGAAIVQNTREVWHETYHIFCARCAGAAKRKRILSAVLSYVGLFIALIALIIIMGAVTWWFIGSASDRTFVQTWIAVPVIILILSAILARFATRLGVPRALHPLLGRPFHPRGLSRV